MENLELRIKEVKEQLTSAIKKNGTYTILNDYLGLLIDIEEGLEYGDYYYINQKLFNYFKEEYYFIGNIDEYDCLFILNEDKNEHFKDYVKEFIIKGLEKIKENIS